MYVAVFGRFPILFSFLVFISAAKPVNTRANVWQLHCAAFLEAHPDVLSMAGMVAHIKSISERECRAPYSKKYRFIKQEVCSAHIDIHAAAFCRFPLLGHWDSWEWGCFVLHPSVGWLADTPRGLFQMDTL